MAGLSWLTILRKRENFRAAFANFEIDAVAGFGTDDVERLLADAGIVRHRGKIEAVINNARAASTSRRVRQPRGLCLGIRARPVHSARVLDREALMQLDQPRVGGDERGPAPPRLVVRRARRRSTRSWRRWASSTTTSSAARSASRWKPSGAPSDDRRAQALRLDPRLGAGADTAPVAPAGSASVALRARNADR